MRQVEIQVVAGKVRELSSNMSLDSDPQRQEAASPHGLRSGQLRLANTMHLQLPPLFIAVLVSGCVATPAANVIDRSSWVPHAAEIPGSSPPIVCHRLEDRALLVTFPRRMEPARLWTKIPNTLAARAALRVCVNDSLRSNGTPTPGYAGDQKRDEFFRSVGACMKAAGYELETENMLVQPEQASC